MLLNVATLLREPVGAARHIEVVDERVEVPDEGYERVVNGDVRLLRTQRGILVRAHLELTTDLECSRCLRTFEAPLELDIDEMFAMLRDPITREPVEGIEADDFKVLDEQYLDLSDAVRQYEESTRPISPLCRPDCRGLCPTCGADLNDGDCACAPEVVSERWSALAGLAERLRTEESHGRSEA
ncbi:MAG: DUF177 domain-containing protein [Dehalococcoidia bacterium]